MSCQATKEPCQFNVSYLCAKVDDAMYQPNATKCDTNLCLPQFIDGKPSSLRCASLEEARTFQIGSKVAASMIRDGLINASAFDNKLNFDD